MSFIRGVVRYEMNEARGNSGLDELFETKRRVPTNSDKTVVGVFVARDVLAELLAPL